MIPWGFGMEVGAASGLINVVNSKWLTVEVCRGQRFLDWLIHICIALSTFCVTDVVDLQYSVGILLAVFCHGSGVDYATSMPIEIKVLRWDHETKRVIFITDKSATAPRDCGTFLRNIFSFYYIILILRWLVVAPRLPFPSLLNFCLQRIVTSADSITWVGLMNTKPSRVLDTGLDLWQSREVKCIGSNRWGTQHPASPGYLYTYVPWLQLGISMA